jgi:KUP system potassium uptake protein
MTDSIQTAEAPDDPGLLRHGAALGVAPSSFWFLALGAIGVVYGDIGTSPLYALREAVNAALAQDGKVTEPLMLGILSLIIWALLLVVTLKYVVVLLQADNKGEGGTLSLMALAQRGRGKYFTIIPVLGMIGAALFYGDAIITPAISVLSAVEGLKIVTPAFDPFVIWISLAIIIGLFAMQSRGTASVSKLFGPITLVWFAALAVSGVVNILANANVLFAFNPVHAITFLSHHGVVGLVTLGAVFLAVTGAEALYADLGHFGIKPIRAAWLFVVLPCLLLNYLGQGALVLTHPETLENPFFLMMPGWALVPMVLLAAAATIIASQAVITGAFSMTRQAVQLGLLPRMRIAFTSESNAGQIYMPQVNWFILVGVIVLVFAFRTSSNLATAYGIAVTGTMVVTAILAMFVIRNRWKWSIHTTLALMLPLLAIDLIFFGANALKIVEGGWMPLALGGFIMLLMWTWRTGTRQIAKVTQAMDAPIATVVKSLAKSSVHRIDGTAIFFTQTPDAAPTALMHSLKHFKGLHRSNIILSVKTADQPYVDAAERMTVTDLSADFAAIEMRFGFMESPDVPKALSQTAWPGSTAAPANTSYFLSRRNLQASKHVGMPMWQDAIFIFLARNGDDASRYFQLPPDRVVELGSRIAI